MKHKYNNKSSDRYYTVESDLKTEEIHEELKQIEALNECSEDEYELRDEYKIKSRRNLKKVNTKLKQLKEILKSNNISAIKK